MGIYVVSPYFPISTMFFRRSIARLFPDQPKRILLIRFGNLCEVLRGTPLLVALRMRFPHSEIAWLVEEQAVSLLQGHQALDRILTIGSNWDRSWNEIQSLRGRLRKFQPEITLDLSGSFSSAFAAWISGAKLRIGFAGGTSGRLRLLNNIRVLADERHEIDRYLQLLEPFGVHGCSVDFDLHEHEMDRIQAKEILHQAGIGTNHHYGILDANASPEMSYWPKEQFVELAKHFFEQWNLPSLVIWNHQNEQTVAESIARKGGKGTFLSPPLTVHELASLIRLATILVGPDSVALGISSAVGTPCVGLFGATQACEVGPYGQFCRSIQAPSASPSLEKIGTSFVCDECDTILSELLEPASLSIKEYDRETPVWALTPAA